MDERERVKDEALLGLSEDLVIDKYNLDEEVARQVEKFVRWGEAHVIALDERDRAKNKLEVLRAKLDSDIRLNPSNYMSTKLTENSIQAAMWLVPEFQQANDDYLNAKKRAEILSIAREAMLQRKSMIESLVKLHLFAYYGDPDARETEIKRGIRQETVNM